MLSNTLSVFALKCLILTILSSVILSFEELLLHPAITQVPQIMSFEAQNNQYFVILPPFIK